MLVAIHTYLIQIDRRIDRHAYEHLDGHIDIRTDPNCIVKENMLLPKKYPAPT